MQKRLLGLLSIFFILTATASGLVLVRQSQNISEKAAPAKLCDRNGFGKCGNNGGCGTEEECVCIGNDCKCKRTDKCSILCEQCINQKCVAWNPNAPKPPDSVCKCEKCANKKCVAWDPRAPNPSDWKPTGDTQCQDGGGGGGGGGGNATPTPTPTPAPKCNGTNPNPAKLSPNGEGTLKIFGTTFRGGSINYKFSLKKNSTTCSPTEADKVVEAQFTEGEVAEVDTQLSLTTSDKVCLFLSYKVGGQERQARGWIAPNGENKCTKNNSSPKDLSPVIEAAGNPFASQCWEIALDECKFNSMGLAFAIGEGGAGPTPSPTGSPLGTPDPNVTGLKVRFQGITQKRNDQKVSVSFDNSWSETDLNVSNDDTGVYTIPVSGVLAGTYDVRVKGHSHLQKLFSNLVYNGVGADLSTSESLQMRAGDVTDDNAITIEDIAQVSSFYTDFSVPVDTNNTKMVAADINKDSLITIQDLALIAINWSDIRIEGDQ